MKWFKDFVKYTVDAWNNSEQKAIYGTTRNPVEELELAPSKIGTIGEEYVASILEDLGYDTEISPRSRSPADVWAVLGYCDFSHIALTQVKTSQSNIPRKLDEDEIEELKAFVDFVWNTLDEYTKIPYKILTSARIITCGYAGIMLIEADDKIQPYVYSSEYIHAVYSDELEDLRDTWESVIKGIHKL
jgi:hypothetical protein